MHVEDERGLVYAISLDASAGARDGVTIEDSRFADGEDLGAIRVFQSGESRGRYRFQRNEFSDLGGRAYFVRTQDRSFVETIILDSAADNIGRGERNSDSIIPYLMGQSEQVMLVRNYRFNNTNQEGNQSNTGIEAYMFGQPRPDEANWCTGCTLTLTILDSVIEERRDRPDSVLELRAELEAEVRDQEHPDHRRQPAAGGRRHLAEPAGYARQRAAARRCSWRTPTSSEPPDTASR